LSSEADSGNTHYRQTKVDEESRGEKMKTKISCLLMILILFCLTPVSQLAQDPIEKKKIVTLAMPYTLRVHAIALSDSRGVRAVAITPEQVKQWVDKANELFKFSGAGIQLAFSTNKLLNNFEVMKNTALNNLASDGTGWKEANRDRRAAPAQDCLLLPLGAGIVGDRQRFFLSPRDGL